ncbi:LCCL domain-containing protein [Pararhodobacter sp. CCB-MM2]|uniref:LCCL domain-containing protein n=1 Tax=Pararhodobacter sp. CCB-MM2 TaxID=1786003 RepID=UPI00082FE58C|nr:LCCL domain-containing protein [Pararhodobacter sp. CCB-MM2]
MTFPSLSRLFSPSGALASLALGVAVLGSGSAQAQACPDWSLQGTPIAFTSEQLWVPQGVNVIAGGNVDLSACPMPGHGYVITQPDFDLSFTGNESANRDLELRVQASCDTVLLVNDASGTWHFSDDDTDLNPRIRITGAPSGAYDVWVGTFGQQTCQAQLILETFGTPPGGSAPAQQTAPATTGGGAMPAPANLTSYRDRVGQTFTFTVTGTDRGSVWGTGVYTDDSAVAAAAVHAGAIGSGQTGDVQVTILPGQQSYAGSAANGVTSSNYGTWSGSYQFILPQAAAAEAAPANLTGYRDRVGQTVTFSVTGSDRGSVWGSGIYTDDSALAVAAVHAGLVGVGETTEVQVQILPGQQSYSGSNANGINTSNYGVWSGSFSFVMPHAAAAPAAPAPAPAAPAAPSAGK